MSALAKPAVPLISPAPVPAPAARLYFVNGLVDFLFLGGLSLLLYGALMVVGEPPMSGRQWNGGIYMLTWICNWPHFAATSYRLYHSKQNIAQYPLTAVAVPILMVLVAAASLAYPAVIAPYFMKFFLLWSPYHYSGQSLGISLIYARRSGFILGRLERLALTLFIFCTFLFSTARFEAGTMTGNYFSISFPPFGIPAIVPKLLGELMYVSGAVFIVLLLWWAVRHRRFFPLIILLPAVSQFVWFVAAWRVKGFSDTVPFFHSLQYLLIAWAMQLKERMDENGIAPSFRYVVSESARWGAGTVLLGIIFFWVLPRLLTFAGYSLMLTQPIVFGAVQVHHFFVDGVIWKLRNPKVRSPLLVNIDEMAGRGALPKMA